MNASEIYYVWYFRGKRNFSSPEILANFGTLEAAERFRFYYATCDGSRAVTPATEELNKIVITTTRETPEI